MRATARVEGDTLRVSGALDADSVVALRATGRDWLAGRGGQRSHLDLAGVDYSSSAGLALLLDWLRAAGAAGGTLHIQGLPAGLAALARVGGLEGLLPLD